MTTQKNPHPWGRRMYPADRAASKVEAERKRREAQDMAVRWAKGGARTNRWVGV